MSTSKKEEVPDIVTSPNNEIDFIFPYFVDVLESRVD